MESIGEFVSLEITRIEKTARDVLRREGKFLTAGLRLT